MVHDGHKNTFSLSLKGEKVVLAPCREGVVSTPKAKKGNNLLSRVNFQEAEKEGMVYALVPCDSSGRADND